MKIFFLLLVSLVQGSKEYYNTQEDGVLLPSPVVELQKLSSSFQQQQQHQRPWLISHKYLVASQNLTVIEVYNVGAAVAYDITVEDVMTNVTSVAEILPRTKHTWNVTLPLGSTTRTSEGDEILLYSRARVSYYSKNRKKFSSLSNAVKPPVKVPVLSAATVVVLPGITSMVKEWTFFLIMSLGPIVIPFLMWKLSSSRRGRNLKLH